MPVAQLDRPERPASPAPPRSRRSLRGLLRRRRPAGVEPEPAGDDTARIARLEAIRAVLEGAREVVQRCWVQDAWYVVRDRRGRLQPVGALQIGWLDQADVAGACLVGALVHASWARRGPGLGVDTGPAIDALWESLQGGPDAAAEPPLHPDARLARVRDLTRWNDSPARDREDVLRLLDVAASRTILAAVRER